MKKILVQGAFKNHISTRHFQNPDFGHRTQVSGIIRSVTNSHWKVLEKSFLILAMLKEY